MECAERERLAHLYAVATSDYRKALDTLTRRAGVVNKIEYDGLLENSEKARVAADESRAEMDRHTTEHGC